MDAKCDIDETLLKNISVSMGYLSHSTMDVE
jgi:hypothetical protein